MHAWALANLTPITDPAAAAAATEKGGSLAEIVSPYMGVFFVAYFVAFALTPVMRCLAVRNGIIDWPDLKRKNHIEPIAYLGGLAIFLGWLAAVGLSYFVAPAASMHQQQVLFPVSIVIGAALVCVTGLFDDVYGISPRVKVGGQLLAAAAIASEDVGKHIVIDFFSLMNVTDMPHWFVYIMGTVVIAVFIVGACNAVNLLDGLDGLASGVTAISCVGFLVLASFIAMQLDGATYRESMYSHVRLVMCLAIIGAILGFLPYNFNPANIFMGDAGSLLLGYLAATTMLLFAHAQQNSLISITACLIIFALPITDTSLAIFRRKLRGQPIFHPDNQHIHHLLRRSGLTVRQAVLTMYLIGAGFAALGCMMVWMRFQWRYMLAVFFVVFGFVIVTAYKIGHRMLVAEQLQKTPSPLTPPVPEPPATPSGQTTAAGSPPPSPMSPAATGSVA